MSRRKLEAVKSLRNRIALLALWVALLTPCAHAARVKVVGDRLSIDATGIPLQQILTEFAGAGVKVSLDPEVNPLITAHFQDRNAHAALKGLLSQYDYVLEWDVVKTPIGPISKIAEIQVFTRGHPENARLLAAPDSRLIPARGPSPDSPLFAKDEILLSLAPGTDAEAFKRLLGQIGGNVVECIPELGVYRIRLLPGSNVADLAAQLSRNPMIRRAEPNYLYQPPAPTPVEVAEAATARMRTLASFAGASPVAVLDTGFNSDPGLGLSNAVVASLDAVSPGHPISDTQGHGTQMALIASGAVSPFGVAGGAGTGGVPVIPIRSFDDQGYATTYGILRSINFAVDSGARVLSLSWGSEVNSQFMQNALALAISKGMIAVAAAGNEPTGKPEYPAAYPGVIAVGALMPDGTLWPQSNYGSFVDLAAPGFARVPVGYRGPPGTYAGTSIATAFVANSIATYLAKHPAATSAEVVSALNAAVGQAGGSPARDSRMGLGPLNAQALAAFLK